MINPDLEWINLNETSFEVRCAAGEKEAIVQFEINDQGDIVKAFSPARPYDVPGGYAEAPWYYEFSDHLEFRGMLIPAAAVAMFDKGGTPWKYFQGRVTSLTFDVTDSRILSPSAELMCCAAQRQICILIAENLYPKNY